MLLRIVKLTFNPDKIADFVQTFEKNQMHIAGFEGCNSVQLLRDTIQPNVFFTYSEWNHEESLDNYRKSLLFGEVWQTVKPWFSAKPEAWSCKKIS